MKIIDETLATFSKTVRENWGKELSILSFEERKIRDETLRDKFNEMQASLKELADNGHLNLSDEENAKLKEVYQLYGLFSPFFYWNFKI